MLNGGTSSNIGSCTLVYITYNGIELISVVIPICCGLPLAIESFSLIAEMTTPLGRDLHSEGWSIFSSCISLFPLCFLSYHCLTDSVHSRSEFSAFLPLLGLVFKPVRALLPGESRTHTYCLTARCVYTPYFPEQSCIPLSLACLLGLVTVGWDLMIVEPS